MKSTEIMAVVVSFNGQQKTLKTIEALATQVDHVHVVDNASDPDSVAMLEEICLLPNISVTWLSQNYGIGYALNIGIEESGKRGYRWLLTMDQDSILATSFIEAFTIAVHNDPSMVCLAANYSGRKFASGNQAQLVKYAISSGNLVRMDVFDRVGCYSEDLFIDGVDFDFSLRVRSSGLNIHMVGGARMQHQLGDIKCDIPVIGKLHTYHSPLRRYYIYRNFLYLVKKYATGFPVFFLKLAVLHLVYLITILLLGKQRRKSLIFIAHAGVDFLRGKKGAWQEK